jgi:hypothetical protein
VSRWARGDQDEPRRIGTIPERAGPAQPFPDPRIGGVIRRKSARARNEKTLAIAFFDDPARLDLELQHIETGVGDRFAELLGREGMVSVEFHDNRLPALTD